MSIYFESETKTYSAYRKTGGYRVYIVTNRLYHGDLVDVYISKITDIKRFMLFSQWLDDELTIEKVVAFTDKHIDEFISWCDDFCAVGHGCGSVERETILEEIA